MDITLYKAKFDELTADLVARTLTCIRNAMNDAGLNASQIDEVLLCRRFFKNSCCTRGC